MAVWNGAIADFGRGARPAVTFAAQRLRRLLWLWMARRHERLALAELDERLLRDIGIDRATALREAQRPFWHGSDPRLRR